MLHLKRSYTCFKVKPLDVEKNSGGFQGIVELSVEF
jgi:hypothetical protein